MGFNSGFKGLKICKVATCSGFAIPGLESQTYSTSALYPGGCGFEYLHLH